MDVLFSARTINGIQAHGLIMEGHILSERYKGSSAEQYDQRRVGVAKWVQEQQVMEGLLSQARPGTKVLDVPVGTGRFIEFYKRFQIHATGVDISADMIQQSVKKAQNHDFEISLTQGNIFDLDFEDGCFDLAVCIRFLNWVGRDDFHAALTELARVSSRHLIIGVRHVVPLREITIYKWRGLSRFFRQCLMRMRKKFQEQGLVFHAKREIDFIFKHLGLQISEAHCVESRSDGTDYFIYLLSKPAPGS